MSLFFYRRERLLRRPLGGRLRAFSPSARNRNRSRRLEEIKKAIIRGELYLNNFNRWRLRESNKSAIGWTFVDANKTTEQAEIERLMALRESVNIQVIQADENTAEKALSNIDYEISRPDLVIIERDWVKHPDPNLSIENLIDVGIKRGLILHIIAALNSNIRHKDKLHFVAKQRYIFESNPLTRPALPTSQIERNFGESIFDAGLNPRPQKSVANYFLDFAICQGDDELPIRLDIEVDGRYWHEEFPGQRQSSDYRRDHILKCLGWRPLRFWDDEIREDEQSCIQRIFEELSVNSIEIH